MFGNILDLLFPRRCVDCRTHLSDNAPICDACLARIPRNDTLLCARCLARLPKNQKTCHQNSPYRLAAATDFRHPSVRELIHALKFESVRSAALPLGTILADYLRGLPLHLDGYLIVPLPLSRARERSRGFNQAALIAQPVAQLLSLPVASGVLVRVRDTHPQTNRPSALDRRANIAGAFTVPRKEDISGRSILLVDDVRTSGATLDEAIRTLKSAGALHVIAAVVARA